MGELRRGAEHMEAPARADSGFSTFVPEVKWREDKEEKYVIFLNALDEVPTVDYHDWVPVGSGTNADGKEYTRYAEFIARTDPWIDEDYDDLNDRLGKKPKRRSVGVAVELEPVTKTVKGRERPVGFEVKTKVYERKLEGGGKETITQPCVGLVVQADPNFWSWLRSYNERELPIEEVPFNVIRDGKDSNTTYNFIPADGKPVNLENLVTYIDGVSYFGDYLPQLQSVISDKEPEEAARLIGNTLLDLRLAELADGERYEKLVTPIEEIRDPFGGNTPAKAAPRPRTRPTNENAPRSERFQALKAELEA